MLVKMEKNREHSCALYTQGSSLLMRFQGLVARGSMLGIQATLLTVALDNDVDRVLIDMSSALVALSFEDWRAFTRDSASRAALRIKAALLVPPLCEEEAWDHAERLTDYGRLCVVFTDRSDAYRWARLDLLAGRWVAKASEA